MNLLFFVGILGIFVSAICIIIRAFRKDLLKPPLIAFGISGLLMLGSLGVARFGGIYNEHYAIHYIYAYSLALEKFKSDKHHYPQSLDVLFAQGYVDKKFSGLRYAVEPISACDGYYFIYNCAGNNFTLYAKPLKNQPTFFLDQTGSIRLSDAHGAMVTVPIFAKTAQPSSPTYKDFTRKRSHRF